MDLNLKDLGATLVTGAYFLTGLLLLSCLVFGWNFFFFLHFARRVSTAALTILTLSMAFGAGMLLEDLSNKFVDSGKAGRNVPFTNLPLLPLEKDLRAETLFDEEFLECFFPKVPEPGKLRQILERVRSNFSTNSARPSPTPGRLSLTAAKLNLFAKYGGEENGANVQKVVLIRDRTKQPTVTREQLVDAASWLYYHAKNTVYTVNNHYDELKQIQTRIDFSRSFAILSLALAIIAFCIGTVALIFPRLGPRIAKQFDRRRQRTRAPTTLLESPTPERFDRGTDRTYPTLGRRAIAIRTLSVITILLIVSLLGRFAYSSEEKEFDKRTYGYFGSLSAGITSPAPTQFAEQSKATTAASVSRPLRLPAKGYSGLVQIDKSTIDKSTTFLVVHDTKAESNEPCLGTLTVQSGSTPLYVPIEFHWGVDPPNDLEAICSVPGQVNHFLVAESGYYDGKFGRIFHISVTKTLSRWNVSLEGIISLPEDTDNVEGLACVADKTGRLILLLGERGGSKKNPTGKIRWGTLDLVQHRFELLGEKNLTVPNSIGSDQRKTRGCADLYVDAQQQIWSVATQDQGDDGPFRSVIYQAGTIHSDAPDPIQLFPETVAAWTFDGVKVEGVGPSPDWIRGSSMSIATDDENYEGIWRPLFSPSPKNMRAR